MRLDQAPVVVRLEELAGEHEGAGEAVAAVDRLDLEPLVELLDDLGVEEVALGALAAEQLLDHRRRRRRLVEDLRLAQEADQLVAELGLQRLRPALVLLEAPVEALPPARW